MNISRFPEQAAIKIVAFAEAIERGEKAIAGPVLDFHEQRLEEWRKSGKGRRPRLFGSTITYINNNLQTLGELRPKQ